MAFASMTRSLAPKCPQRQHTLVVILAMAGFLLLLPFVVKNPMLLHVWIMVLIAIAQGGAWNIVGGYAGQHSIGHSVYFGVGAYTAIMSLEQWHLSPFAAAGLAAFNALALALIVGTITFRLRGPYFVLASISVAEIIRLTALEWKTLTHGAEGILLTAVPTLRVMGVTVAFDDKVPFFYLSLVLATLVVTTNFVVERSKLGYYFVAIREDQEAARSLGINLTLYKNVALCLSAVFTAWAGGVWVLYVKYLDPSLAFGIDVSVQMLLIAIVGGIGTILGPVVGAVVLVLVSETLRNPKWLVAVDLVADDSLLVAFVQRHLSNAHVLFYGIMVVVVVLFAPDGVLGLLRNAARDTRRRLEGSMLATKG